VRSRLTGLSGCNPPKAGPKLVAVIDRLDCRRKLTIGRPLDGSLSVSRCLGGRIEFGCNQVSVALCVADPKPAVVFESLLGFEQADKRGSGDDVVALDVQLGCRLVVTHRAGELVFDLFHRLHRRHLLGELVGAGLLADLRDAAQTRPSGGQQRRGWELRFRGWLPTAARRPGRGPTSHCRQRIAAVPPTRSATTPATDSNDGNSPSSGGGSSAVTGI